MRKLSEVWAVGRYEFRMQVRKRSLWLASLVLGVLIVLTQGEAGPRYLPPETPVREVMVGYSLVFAIVLPLGFGTVLADRVVRDKRLRVTALLESLPLGQGSLLAGKYLGNVAATALPGLAAMLAAAGYESVHRQTLAAFGWAVAAFALVLLPGLAFIAGFALVCPLVLSAPLFRILFVGYWFWGNMLSPAFLPSLTGTLLTPIGDYAASWLRGETALYAGVPGWLSFLRPEPSGATAAASIALLIAGGLLPLVVAGWLRSWSARRA